jgi:hypothetical protein
MVDPVKEVFDLPGAFGGVEQFKRRFALQHLRRAPKPARRLVLRSEGFLGGGKNPNHSDQPVRLLRRKPANLAPMAQGLSRQDDSINFGESQPAGLQQFLYPRDGETLSGGFDHPAAGLPTNSRDLVGS